MEVRAKNLEAELVRAEAGAVSAAVAEARFAEELVEEGRGSAGRPCCAGREDAAASDPNAHASRIVPSAEKAGVETFLNELDCPLPMPSTISRSTCLLTCSIEHLSCIFSCSQQGGRVIRNNIRDLEENRFRKSDVYFQKSAVDSYQDLFSNLPGESCDAQEPCH